MRRRVASRTGAESLTTRETVATETPARRATSLIVTASAVLLLRDRRTDDRGVGGFVMGPPVTRCKRSPLCKRLHRPFRPEGPRLSRNQSQKPGYGIRDTGYGR